MVRMKEISKAQYKTMVWGSLIGGLVINAIISHFFIISGVTDNQMRLGFYLGISLIIVGYGVGLAMAHSYKIMDGDN